MTFMFSDNLLRQVFKAKSVTFKQSKQTEMLDNHKDARWHDELLLWNGITLCQDIAAQNQSANNATPPSTPGS